MEPKLADVAIARIRPNPQQPRTAMDEDALRELADSMREHGLIQRVEVEADPASRVGGFILHHGHRRVAAAKLLGWEYIPAIIVAPLEEEDQLTRALVENLQREDMNPIDEARSYAALLAKGLSKAEVCRRVGKSSGYVSNLLDWLELDETTQSLLATGGLPRDKRVREALLAVPEMARPQLVAKIAGQSVKGIVKAAGVFTKMAGAKAKVSRTYDCPPKPNLPKKPYSIMLVLGHCPMPGPAAEEMTIALMEACKKCPFFEYKQGVSCEQCAATVFLRKYVEQVEGAKAS